MDSSLWHRQAVAPPATAPLPLNSLELDSLLPSRRASYASQVRAGLRAQPVPSPLHEDARDQLDRALESALLEPRGARTMLALSAPYTAGKSTLVKDWAQHRYRQWSHTSTGDPLPVREVADGVTADHVPVCYLTLLGDSKAKGLYTQIITFLRHRATGAERTLALRSISAMAVHGVRALILDDAHMLHSRSVTGRATMDAIKHLNTELGELDGVLILVGADLSTGDVLADPQIRGRLSEHQLATYGVESDSQRRNWQQFLRNCEDRVLPYLPSADRRVFSSQLATYIWHRSQGYIGDASRLIIDGAVSALATDRTLDRGLLDTVRLSQRADEAFNDFSRDQNSHPKRRIG